MPTLHPSLRCTHAMLSTAAFVFALAGSANAADKPAAKAPAAKAPAAKPAAKAPLLTRDELRECMAQQERNKTQSAGLEAEATQINAEKAAIIKRGDELKEQLAALDRTNVEAVQAYNTAAAARDFDIETFNARSTDFNTRVQAAQAARAAYSKACDNRSFDERDEAAIRSGK